MPTRAYDTCACGNRKQAVSKVCRECRIKTQQKYGSGIPTPTGEDHHRWNGGRRDHPAGYIELLIPGYRGRDGDYVLEHVYVMEEQLGRRLVPGEHVHHVNKDRRDNRLENLRLLTNSEHAKLHARERALARLDRSSSDGTADSGALPVGNYGIEGLDSGATEGTAGGRGPDTFPQLPAW